MERQESDRRLRRWWNAAAGRLPPRARRLALRLVERDLLLAASSLAFYGFVSVLPLLTVTFTVVGATTGEGTLERLAQQAQERGPAGTGQLLDQLRRSGDSRSWLAIVFTLWPATAYGGGLRRALTRTSGRDEVAPALRGRLTAIGLVVALPVLVLAGLPLVAVLTTLSDDGVVGALLGWGLALVAGTAALTLVIAVLYAAFTPAGFGWWSTVRGAALTATITTLFSVGFLTYLRFGDVEARFGGATIGLVVMLGVYLFVANTLLLAGFQAVVELDGDDDGAPDRADDGADADRDVAADVATADAEHDTRPSLSRRRRS